MTGAPPRPLKRGPSCGLLGAPMRHDALECEGGPGEPPAPPRGRNPGASLFPDDFKRFAEANPNFAEEHLYPEQTRPPSCVHPLPAPTPNGFCADFSPEPSAAGMEPFRKKLD